MKVISKTHIPSKELAIVYVHSDREMPRDGPFPTRVVLDGVTLILYGVERNLPNRPIAKGEVIGLGVSDDVFDWVRINADIEFWEDA